MPSHDYYVAVIKPPLNMLSLLGACFWVLLTTELDEEQRICDMSLWWFGRTIYGCLSRFMYIGCPVSPIQMMTCTLDHRNMTWILICTFCGKWTSWHSSWSNLSICWDASSSTLTSVCGHQNHQWLFDHINSVCPSLYRLYGESEIVCL